MVHTGYSANLVIFSNPILKVKINNNVHRLGQNDITYQDDVNRFSTYISECIYYLMSNSIVVMASIVKEVEEKPSVFKEAEQQKGDGFQCVS